MSSYLSHVTIDCRNAYDLSEWWKPVLGFVDLEGDPNLPGHEECLIRDPDSGQQVIPFRRANTGAARVDRAGDSGRTRDPPPRLPQHQGGRRLVPPHGPGCTLSVSAWSQRRPEQRDGLAERPRPDDGEHAERPGQPGPPSDRAVLPGRPESGGRAGADGGPPGRVHQDEPRVPARPDGDGHPHQVGQLAGDPRALRAGDVVDDDHRGGPHGTSMAATSAPAQVRASSGRTTGSARAHTASRSRRRSRRSTAAASRAGPPRTRPPARTPPGTGRPARPRAARGAAAPTARRCASRCPSRSRTAARPTGAGAAHPPARAGRSPAPGTAAARTRAAARARRAGRTGPPAPGPAPAPAAAPRARPRRTPPAAPREAGRHRRTAPRARRARPARSAGTPSCGFKCCRSWRTPPPPRPRTTSSPTRPAREPGREP